jgi:hypothetical protein
LQLATLLPSKQLAGVETNAGSKAAPILFDALVKNLAPPAKAFVNVAATLPLKLQPPTQFPHSASLAH